ncbi:MAG: hypothetical protein K2O45_16570, partial [Oscillospiraceae bacterium]|nr:hypothetical protein [Oscillospiraceae bacterium]
GSRGAAFAGEMGRGGGNLFLGVKEKIQKKNFLPARWAVDGRRPHCGFSEDRFQHGSGYF